jgi:hypothetical protein
MEFSMTFNFIQVFHEILLNLSILFKNLSILSKYSMKFSLDFSILFKNLSILSKYLMGFSLTFQFYLRIFQFYPSIPWDSI